MLVVVLLSLVVLFGLTRSSTQVVQTWQQPESIVYDSATYYLSVVEADLDFSGFPLSVSRRYRLYVGREKDAPTDGHWLDFTFYADGDNLVAHIRRSQVDWSAEGVTFRSPSGHRLSTPKKLFVGGK